MAVERYFNSSAVAAAFPDPGGCAQHRLQLVLECFFGSIARLVCFGFPRFGRLYALNLGLDLAHAPAVFHGIAGKIGDFSVVLQPEQRPRMPGRQLPGLCRTTH